MAGNTPIKMRNMGVVLLDTLLTSAINQQLIKLNMKKYTKHILIIQSYYINMEREIVLSSYNVKDKDNNTPGNFVTHFNPLLIFDKNHEYSIGLNRIITMSFTWTNINAGYKNQLIKFSKDGGSTFSNIEFRSGVRNYDDRNRHIGQKTVFKDDGRDVYPIKLEFDEPTFRVTIRLKENSSLILHMVIFMN